jgi:hypothetical protein
MFSVYVDNNCGKDTYEKRGCNVHSEHVYYYYMYGLICRLLALTLI